MKIISVSSYISVDPTCIKTTEGNAGGACCKTECIDNESRRPWCQTDDTGKWGYCLTGKLFSPLTFLQVKSDKNTEDPIRSENFPKNYEDVEH